MLRPLDDLILVERDDAQDISDGGVALAKIAQDTPNMGRVLAVGPGLLLSDGTRGGVSVKPGERVVFLRNAGVVLDRKANQPDKAVMREDEILAVIEEE